MIIAFDLDGTISDPIVGVAASINYALEKLGLSRKSQTSLETYIGPPLQEIFADLLRSSDEEQIRSAIFFFRERYSAAGYRENTLYPGLVNALDVLSAAGHTFYIATSKKESIARSVAAYFGIADYFRSILGCGLKRRKVDLLTQIQKMEKTEQLMMVGDRLHDMEAGRAAGCFCIGVLWGYGSREELVRSGADRLCRHPGELPQMIEAWNRNPSSEEAG